MSTDIERLAKEAGLDRSRCAKDPRWLGSNEHLAKFAALMAEECAKECEVFGGSADETPDTVNYGYARGAEYCASAIRAKFALSSDKPETK